MTATQFTVIFLCFLFGRTLTELWLKARYINHIRRYQTAVPEAFSATITLAQHQRAARYSIDKAKTGMLIGIVDAIMLLCFTVGGVIEWLTTLCQNWFASGTASGITTIAAVVIIHGLIMLPFSIYQTFVVEARHGFNQMTPRLFVMDGIKTILLSAILGLPVLWIILQLMDKAGNLWWFYAWAFWTVLSFVLMIAYPKFIAPLFNKFQPLTDQDLKARIESLLNRCQFTSNGIFVMDGSRRSSHGNAYFTGIGKSKRIVFFDTLLSNLDPPEIEAVLAHELGHFRKKHIRQRLFMSFALTLMLFAALGFLVQSNWFFQGLGVSSINNANALLLFFMVVPVFTFAFTPLASYLSRKHEFEADTYAAQETNATDLIHALVKLYRDNAASLTPDPLHSLFYDSHPPATIRIASLEQQIH